MGRKNKKSSKMTMSKKNYIESLPRELLIDIIERIASYSLKDLMRVKLSSKVLNQVANEPSVYQKVTLVNFPYCRWSIFQEAISFLEKSRASGNLEALYRKSVFDFFNRNDPTTLGMINQAADGGHIGASYVLAIISIFNGGESMREGLMFIANMKKTEPLKVRRCRHNLRNILGGMWVPEPHLLGERPICCTVHQFERIGRMNGWPMGRNNEDDICCDLCSCDLELDYVVKFLPYTTVWELLIDIVERIASYSLKDLMRVKLRVLNQVANEPYVYQKVILLSILIFIWSCSVVRRCTSFLEMCKASGNLEALYRKGVYDFFNRSDSNGLGILSQAADGGHIGAFYVLAIILIFNGGESMREDLIMFIANMTPLKLRRCREKLRYTLYGRVLESHLLGERPICCTVQSLHFCCELCRCDLEIDESAWVALIHHPSRKNGDAPPDVDIRSKFVILRLTNKIKELEIDDENHIKRKGSSVATYESFVATFVSYVAINGSYVATYESSVATFGSHVATYMGVI
ncbi:hypothetical protein H5410_004850 [Solanum commersonii]|uniref:F-box domain-containing protein n=1 Tax=Solanum commersonii TaxID=4109 RepID=A0A9J6A5H8_SOLCO|nr:hypothetical protein H5410_004850 [Solanum commersonii]